MLHIIRFLGLFLFMPCMKLTGYDFTLKHVVLLSYSGLRGAVGLCLALIVKFNDKIDDDIKDQVMFFTAGIVLLTLIINGTTTGMVIRKLGMIKENEMSKRMLAQVLESHDSKALEFITNWKRERSEHGDKKNVFAEEHIDINEIRKNKIELIEDLRLRKVEALYPDIVSKVKKELDDYQKQGSKNTA